MSKIANDRAGAFSFGSQMPRLLPSIAALIYPFALAGLYRDISRIRAGAGPLSWAMAVVCLVITFAVPLVSLLIAMRVEGDPFASQTALLAIAAPPFFVLISSAIRGNLDIALWFVFWAAALFGLALSRNRTFARPTPSLGTRRFRIPHGITALSIVVMAFLLFHICNQLFGLAGPDLYSRVMHWGRHVYREPLIEPLLALVFLFQTATGLYLLWRGSNIVSDRFRTLQTASGCYLSLFLLSHMNAVLLFGRMHHVETGWAFATGGTAGLLGDPRAIRLVPYYAFVVFFAVAHLATHLRVAMLRKSVSRLWANRFVDGATVLAGVTAVAIVLGMCGVRLHLPLRDGTNAVYVLMKK